MRELQLKFIGRFRDRIQTIDVPERYSELSSKQFHLICALTRNEVEQDDFVFKFFGIKAEVWKTLPPFYHYILTGLVTSLKSQAISRFFDSFVRICGESRILTTPSAMPLIQFMNADTFAQWYEFTKKDVYLIDFFCQLAMPDEDTDYVRHSTSGLHELITQHIDSDPTIRPLLLDTYINWQLIKSYLTAQYPNMFPSADSENADASTKPRPSNWYDVFDALIGEHLENIEAYKKVPAFDAFRIIDSRIRDKKFHS